MSRDKMSARHQDVIIRVNKCCMPIEYSDRRNDNEEWKLYTGEFPLNFDDYVYRVKQPLIML